MVPVWSDWHLVAIILKKTFKTVNGLENTLKQISFVIVAVPADGPVPLGAGTSASPVMTWHTCRKYTGLALPILIDFKRTSHGVLGMQLNCHDAHLGMILKLCNTYSARVYSWVNCVAEKNIHRVHFLWPPPLNKQSLNICTKNMIFLLNIFLDILY